MNRISSLTKPSVVAAVLTVASFFPVTAQADELVFEAASSCSGAQRIAQLQETFPRQDRHDHWLIGEAIRAEVNKERCVAGLQVLLPDRALMDAAALHNSDIVKHRFFAHRSPVAGRTTPQDRITTFGGHFNLTAENLGQAWYMDYQSGRHFQIIDEARCSFTYTDGSPIERHSYASLAETLVAAWMDSPGHRANILLPNATLHGAAVGPSGDPVLCGQLFSTQLFAR